MRSSVDKQNGTRRENEWRAITGRQQTRGEAEVSSGVGEAGT